MEDIENENYLDKCSIPVTIEETNKILEQLQKCVCKIQNEKGNGTGFFCYLKSKNKIPVLITNNHIINEKIIKKNKFIKVTLNDEKETKLIEINEKKKIYTNPDKKVDITIIEINTEKEDIHNFLELDEDIFQEYFNLPNESLYILQYPRYSAYEQKAAVSYGMIKSLDTYEILHYCSTNNGSSGAPILRLKNNKVIGIHKAGYIFNYNFGSFLRESIKEYLNNCNLIEIKNEPISMEAQINNKEITYNEIFSLKRYNKHPNTGLVNKGYSSHLNAVLQTLGNIRNFVAYFLNPKNENFFENNIKISPLSFLTHRLFTHLYPFPEKEKSEIYNPSDNLTIILW